MVGVIVGVQATSLTDVQGFTLRTTDGDSVQFAIGDLENGSQFPPGHLVEHQSTAQPIRVWYRTEDGVKVAIRLEDAHLARAPAEDQPPALRTGRIASSSAGVIVTS